MTRQKPHGFSAKFVDAENAASAARSDQDIRQQRTRASGRRHPSAVIT
jgi:hypothetical protein